MRNAEPNTNPEASFNRNAIAFVLEVEYGSRGFGYLGEQLVEWRTGTVTPVSLKRSVALYAEIDLQAGESGLATEFDGGANRKWYAQLAAAIPDEQPPQQFAQFN